MNAIRLSLFALAATLACLDGYAADTRETRNVSGFNAIELAVPAKLQLTQGDKEGMTIEGDSADLANIDAVVESGTLHIRPKSRLGFRWTSRVRIAVDAKQVEKLGIAGAGDITSASLRTPSLKLGIAGSGDIRIAALETERAELKISGSGDMRLAGKATVIESHISGSGDVRAERLEAKRVKVSIAGAGDVSIWAREALEVKIAGAGDVRYYGDPTIEKKIAGAGSLKRLGLAPS